jgi:hypothetical protein
MRRLRYVGNTLRDIFGKFMFNILYRSEIGKRLIRAVEAIFYQPFSEPRVELLRA